MPDDPIGHFFFAATQPKRMLAGFVISMAGGLLIGGVLYAAGKMAQWVIE